MLTKLPVWLLLIISASGVVSGDYFAKYWSINHKPIFVILAFVGYAISSLFYFPTLLSKGLVVTSVAWSVLSIIGFMVVGILIFNETLTPTQWLGAGFGIVSLVILAFSL